ncbi:hypothetical protein K503DRAFT_802542 [Rhizopogon vinicolor AM-OR11-026]|uniref:F-box domain-containing protein n=1 Tax=Rhizopogon vinicolor AM-OR11-026 TaxID=1314800 RepID=A0A1B7MT46_9AGAM|nr:hypothetical protein K503DRAFT_802542 [Rhizopogon vinicolor AM-OR11-026]
MYIYLLPAEILLDIFQSIHDGVDELGYPYHYTTAALARTCRLFKEPALNTLWKNIIGLTPLISCLPEGVSERTQGYVTLTRLLSPEEWNTVGQYARRIRSLIIYDSQLARIDDRLMQLLISMPSPTPLLQNLRSLEWWDDRECFFPLLRTLLVPTISSVKLGSVGCRPWAPTFAKSALLASLGARSPSIQELVCAYSGADDSHEICEFVCSWQELSHLVTGVLNIRSLHHLASLPSLKSLHFRIHEFNDTQSNLTPIFSSQLDEVSITAPAPSFFSRCLRNVHFLSCRTVVLCVGESDGLSFSTRIAEPPYDSLDVPDLIDSLSKSFSSTLEHISINFGSLRAGLDDPNLVLGFDAVAPLMSFSRLTKLDLKFFCISIIDDAALKIIAQSWPQLEHFLFGSATRRLDPPSLTFTGLVHLIQHCRHLRNIEMPFNACAIDITCEPFSNAIPNEKITSIFVGISPITGPAAVACQLHMLLPNLTTVKAGCILPSLPRPFKHIKDEWKKVDEFLAVLSEGAKMKEKLGQLSQER